MGQEWIRERFEKHKDRIAKQRLREQLQTGAVAACSAMLARLKAQIKTDMEEYNALFGQSALDHHCVATGKDLNNGGFSVSVGSSSVLVMRQAETTVICFEYQGDAAKKNPADCVEAYPDENGNLGYWHGKDDRFLREGELSRIILEPVFCG